MSFLLTFVNFSPVMAQDDSLVFKLEGHVLDKDFQIPLENALIELNDDAGNTFEVRTDSNGSFEAFLKPETSYSIRVLKENFLSFKSNETTIGYDKSRVFRHEYNLLYNVAFHPLPVVFFEKNTLTPIDSAFFYEPTLSAEIKSLVSIINSYSGVLFSIYGLNNVDEDEALAMKRAKRFYDMLVKEGADPNRLKIDNSNIPNYDKEEDFQDRHFKKFRESIAPLDYWKRCAGVVIDEL